MPLTVPPRFRRVLPLAPLRLALIAALLLLCARPAAADDARARAHNESAKRLFNLGLFREAGAEYKQAYTESAKPAFLYNLGQCYKRLPALADLELARWYFQGFLKNAPDSPLRAHVEAELAKLERRIADARAAAPSVGGKAPVYKRWWFWTLIGAAVTGAAVGTALALRPSDMHPPGTTAGSVQLDLRGGLR